MRSVLVLQPKYIRFVVENIEEEVKHISKRLDCSEKGRSIYFYLQGMSDAYENVLSQLTEAEKENKTTSSPHPPPQILNKD